MLRIFIKTTDWKEVDFNDVNLALNDAMINITNPIKMSTEYSKTISLPLTAHNRDVFNHYERLDSLVTSALDPSKAIPARVECNGDTIFEGYFALTKVDIGNNKIEGNLYSYINVWVNKMKNLTWDNFPQLLPADLKIDRYSVYVSWLLAKDRHNSTPSSANYGKETRVEIDNSLLQDGEYVPSVIYKDYWMYHIGFAPTTNGTPAQFATNNIVGATTDSSAGQTVSVWKGMSNYLGDIATPKVADGMTSAAISTAESILKNPSERQMMQFRSYNQKPFIFINWLCKLVQWYCNNNDDMPNMDIDPEWAVYSNPNWHDLVYVLPDILKEDSEAVLKSAIFNLTDIEYDSATVNSMPNNGSIQAYNSGGLAVYTEDDPEETIVSEDGWILSTNKTIDYILPISAKANFKFEYTYHSSDEAEARNATNIYWNKKVRLIGVIECYAGLKTRNGDKIPGTEKLVKRWSSTSTIIQTTKTTTTSPTYGIRDTYSWNLNGTGIYTWNGVLASDARPYIEWRFRNSNNMWDDGYNSYSHAWMLWTPDITGMGDYENLCVNYLIPKMVNFNRFGYETDGTTIGSNIQRIKYADAARSGKALTMKELWYTENENSIFNVFLKYLKMMNLVIVYDNFSNRLSVLPREKWMNQGYQSGIEDWTHKIDYGKEISFKPLNWEDKYVELNYEKTDVDKLKDFSEKYGYTYGTKRIGTSYSFNSNTKKLIEESDVINASGELSEYQYNLWQVKDITDNLGSATVLQDPVLPDESYPINRSKDKAANIGNCFFYYKTNCYDTADNVYNIQLPSWDNIINKVPVKKSITPSNPDTPDLGTIWDYIAITDDCQYENNNGTYCFQPAFRKTYSTETNPYYSVTCYGYNDRDVRALRISTSLTKPTLSHYIERWTKSTNALLNTVTITNTPYCCLFSTPREDYFNPASVSRNTNDLWSTRWANLIPELYNEQNKLLTCRVYLTPKDYNQFKFNKFIFIKGVLYLVNKIIDYDPSSPEATKCEFIQVFNPEAYTASPLITRTSTVSADEIEDIRGFDS